MKGTKYSRLTLDDREEISRGLVVGKSFRDIANYLRRSVSTISREVLWNDRDTYRASCSHRRAENEMLKSVNLGNEKY